MENQETNNSDVVIEGVRLIRFKHISDRMECHKVGLMAKSRGIITNKYEQINN